MVPKTNFGDDALKPMKLYKFGDGAFDFDEVLKEKTTLKEKMRSKSHQKATSS
mgnify:CR=1 FL=1